MVVEAMVLAERQSAAMTFEKIKYLEALARIKETKVRNERDRRKLEQRERDAYEAMRFAIHHKRLFLNALLRTVEGFDQEKSPALRLSVDHR